MKFLAIWTPNPKTNNAPMTPAEMEKMGKFMAEEMKRGNLVETGALLPLSGAGALLRSSKGKITLVDGPFAEAKEGVAGFAVLQGKTRAEVIEAAKRFVAVAGDGESELRQIMDSPEDPRR